MRGVWVRIAACALLLPGLAAAELRVCLPSDGAPLSLQRTGRGLDLDVARALAARLGRALTLVWVTAPEMIQEVEISDLPLGNLVRGDCDLVPSVPGAVSLEPFEAGVALTRPYTRGCLYVIRRRLIDNGDDFVFSHCDCLV